MTKKIFGILLVVVLVATIVPAAVFAKSPKTEFDLNGPHFNLNLLGKRDGWNDKEVSNPDRHTMFVPMDTSGWNITLELPNKVVNHGAKVGDNVTYLDGFGIFMTQSGADDFAVIDGTAFDGDPCELDLAAGKYKVVVVAKAKPTSQNATIDGWAQVHNTTGLYYYLNLGDVSVGRKWRDATDLFFIDTTEASIGETGLPDPGTGNEGLGMWIFDYLKALEEMPEYDDTAYFWQLQNNGSKLIQVRFYPYNFD
jgi:hypothetical protein